MQATVRDYDPGTSSGSVLLDDGVELGFDAAAFATSRLRHLRPGQRLSIVVTSRDGVPVVTEMSLHGV